MNKAPTILLCSEQGSCGVVCVRDIRRYVKAPRHPQIRFADRYELLDESVWWGDGIRSWYDEHALQGGLRIIDYQGTE